MTNQYDGEITYIYQAAAHRQPTAAELLAGEQGAYDAVTGPELNGGLPNIRASLAASTEVADQVRVLFQDVLGRAPTAAELSRAQAALGSTASLDGLRAYVATSAEATADLQRAYASELNRAATSAEITSSEQAIANGASLAGLSAYNAAGTEAAGQLGYLYQAVTGRAITPAELATARAALAADSSIAQLRSTLAQSPAGSGHVTFLYNDVLGRAPTAAELGRAQSALASTASLSGLRAYLATSPEATADLTAAYQASYGRAPGSAELAAAQQGLANGNSLAGTRSYLALAGNPQGTAFLSVFKSTGSVFPPPILTQADAVTGLAALNAGASVGAAVASTPTVVAEANSLYLRTFGLAPTAAESAAIVTAYGAAIQADPSGQPQDLGKAVTSVGAASAEVAAAISASYAAALGRPATAIELAATRSELFADNHFSEPDGPFYDLTVSLATVKAQIATLSQAVPPERSPSVNPVQTVPGVPGFVYSLGNNNALIAAQQETVAAVPNGVAVTGFNPATDVIQIEGREVPSFAALELLPIDNAGSQGTRVDLGNGSIFLAGVQASALTAANFSFLAPLAAQPYPAVTAAQAAAAQAAYAAVLNRAPTPAELGSAEHDLASGQTAVDLRQVLSTTSEAANALRALFQSELGRPIGETAPVRYATELARDQAALATGSFTGLRTYLSTTTEAASKLLQALESGKGAPGSIAELSAAEAALASGASLQAAAAANLGGPPGTVPASSAIQILQTYQALFSQPEPVTDLAASEQALAGGASVDAAVLANADTGVTIARQFFHELGIAPTVADTAAVGMAFASIAAAQTTPALYPAFQQAIARVVADTPNVANGINTAFQTAIGRPANAVELAAQRSLLPAYRSLPLIENSIAGNFAGRDLLPSSGAVISPQTIDGMPGRIYGLDGNVALIAAGSETVTALSVTGFNPLTDIFQIESHETPNFAAIKLSQTGAGPSAVTLLAVGNGSSIQLYGVDKSTVTAADFRFV